MATPYRKPTNLSDRDVHARLQARGIDFQASLDGFLSEVLLHGIEAFHRSDGHGSKKAEQATAVRIPAALVVSQADLDAGRLPPEARHVLIACGTPNHIGTLRGKRLP